MAWDNREIFYMIDCPDIMTVKEMKDILMKYADNDKIYILSLHYDDHSVAALNVRHVDESIGEEILYDNSENW